jgi:DNA-binding response OmpR family regulator
MKNILVVEDDKLLASAYRVKLAREGFDVRMAGDGQEALEILNEYAPDLIILDLIMPKLDGFGFLTEIKKIEEKSNIPVIVASNLGQSEDVVRAVKLGAADYIVKTDLSMKNLIEKIYQILKLSPKE